MDRAARVAAVEASEAFGALPRPVIRALATAARAVPLVGGETLLTQGDPATYSYLVARGRLRASRRIGDEETVIGEIGVGELVGEQALVDDRPRSATVRAVRDSEVLRLAPDAVLHALREEPAALRNVLRRILERSSGAGRPVIQPATSLVVVRAGSDPAAAKWIARALTAELERWGGARVVNPDVAARAVGRAAVRSAPDGAGNAEVGAWMHGLEQEHAYVVYEAETAATEWSQRCLRQADLVLLVGEVGANPARSPVEDHLFALGSTVHPRTDLVLVHPSGAPRPTTTASWLEGRSVDRHHHVRRDQPADIGRLARHVTGRAIGLVLGGGGARGLAHLGVLDALEHFGVPIDSAGGTSIGAIIGAAAALGWNREERLEHVIRPLTTSGRLLRPTLPIVALSSSRRLTNMIQREAGFGPGTIEDLWLPYFCVSANLTRAEPVVHERGPLWLALRASISLPGIMPPVYADGDLLVDGGVVDNLPIDDMRRRGVGRVIAVDLHRDVDVASPAPFDPDVSGWRMLRRRFRKTDPVPNVLEITMRAKDISSLRAQRAALADRPPDLLLTPPLASTPLLDFPAAEPLIKTAREYALAQLESRAEEIGSWL